MLDFENCITNLFDRHDVDYQFNENRHLLTSESINILCIPNCSEPYSKEFLVLPEDGFTIRLWEDVYHQHQPVVLSRITSILGFNKKIHGRNTRVEKINQKVLDNFILNNHLNVPIKAKYRLGLYQQEKLVAVAAFGRSCPIQVNEITYRSHELVRFGSLLNHTVVGGLSKLIHYFEKNYKPEHLMTSIDREWSTGGGFIKLGFKIESITPPQQFYYHRGHCSRVYASSIHRGEAKKANWQLIENMGNLKLIKFV